MTRSIVPFRPAAAARRRPLVAAGLTCGVATVAVAVPVAAAPPTPVESGWSVVLEASVPQPLGLAFEPGGTLLVGQRISSGSVRRLAEDGTLTTAGTLSEWVGGLAVDPATGAAFRADDYGGRVRRLAPDPGADWTTWVSGFAGGDDDPVGMTFAPADHAGPWLAPGDGVVVDRGFNGPEGLWRFSADAAEGETAILGDDPAFDDPVDVAVTTDEIFIVDRFGGPDDTGVLWRVADDAGSPGLAVVAVDPPLGRPEAVVADPADGTLLVLDAAPLDGGDARVLRVDPGAGTSAVVLDGLQAEDQVQWGNLALDASGTRLAVAMLGPDLVWILERACPEAPGDVDGDGGAGLGDVLAILSAWGPCPEGCGACDCVGDLDEDCAVTLADLLEVLGAWG